MARKRSGWGERNGLPSEATQQRVLAEIERDPTVSDASLTERLCLRGETIYAVLILLTHRGLIHRDVECQVWERATPPWLRTETVESDSPF